MKKTIIPFFKQNTPSEINRAVTSDPGERSTMSAAHNNLTLPRTRLIGRDHEITAIQQLLLQEHLGLLTLTGPGGIGKTRLALQVAANLLDHFVDGVYFVALAPISDPDLVSTAIAQTLSVRAAPGRSVQESLQVYLRDKQLLLVLDNFEQILSAALLVSTLLTECRRLKVLVTSRAPLHLYGEQEFPVPPLALPIFDFRFGVLDSEAGTADQSKIKNLKSKIDVERLAESPAVALFCQRARKVKPDFALTATNAVAVAQICISLDGLPLAIELAAAKLKLFSPPALLARLNERLTLLTDGPHDLPTRQRTLRAEIAWSYDLLAADEQTLFRRLAVFVGGFTLEAAQAIGNLWASVGQVAEYTHNLDVLAGVAALVDKNLLRQLDSADREARFGMVETIRAYGLERLAESGETAMIYRQHLDFFLALAEAMAPSLLGAQREETLARLALEFDNLRVALARSQHEVDDGEVGLRLAGALIWFAYFGNHFREGRSWLLASLQRTTEPTAARAKALWGAGLLALNQGDYPIARLELEASEAIWRTLGNQLGLAITLRDLCIVAHLQGRSAAEQQYAEESVALCRAAGSPWDLALALDNLAYTVAEQGGDQTTAHALFTEERALFQSVGDAWGVANALMGLGCMAYEQGNETTARAHFEQALAIRRTKTDQWSVAATLNALGQVRQRQGALAEAGNLYREALLLTYEVGDKAGMALVFYLLGAHAYAQKQVARAACLLAVAAVLRALTGAAYHTLDQHDSSETLLAAVRTQLGEEIFAVQWAAGEALSVEQAIAYASAAPEDGLRSEENSTTIPLPPAQPAGLTKRETEVLRLLVQGLTYTQIADKLVVSRRTVNVHATAIYSKLGVTSRAMATRVALEQHLI